MRLFSALMFLLIICPLAQGQYCRWEDEKGTVHYAQECPENKDSKPVDLEAPPSARRVKEADDAYSRPGTPVDSSLEADEPGYPIAAPNRRPKTIEEEDVNCPRGNLSQYVERMDNRCESARAREIRPAYEREVQACVDEGVRTRKECERFHADFLNPNWVGRLEPRAFDYLPECVIARVCREQARMEDNTYRGKYYRWRNRDDR